MTESEQGVRGGCREKVVRTVKPEVLVCCCLTLDSSQTEKSPEFLQGPFLVYQSVSLVWTLLKTGPHVIPGPSAVLSVDPRLMHPKTEPTPPPPSLLQSHRCNLNIHNSTNVPFRVHIIQVARGGHLPGLLIGCKLRETCSYSLGSMQSGFLPDLGI